MSYHPFKLGSTLALAVATAALFGVGVSKPANAATTLTVYTALEAEELQPIREAFRAEYPDIDINWVRDSTGIITAKMLAEIDAGNPQADVFFGTSATGLLLVDAKGMLLPYTPKGIDKIDPKFRDPRNPPHWVGSDAYAAVVCFNTVEAKKFNLPKPSSWKDLIDPVYKGRLVMPNPNSSGTGFLTVSSWMQIMGEDAAWKYMDALHQNMATYTHSGSKPLAIGLAHRQPDRQRPAQPLHHAGLHRRHQRIVAVAGLHPLDQPHALRAHGRARRQPRRG